MLGIRGPWWAVFPRLLEGRSACAALVAIAVGVLVVPISPLAQQVVDPAFDASVQSPAFSRGKGPLVAIDDGHQNFHTRTGNFAPFSALLENDGYRVIDIGAPFNDSVLSNVAVLVIANAGSNDDASWRLPTHSALARDEIESVTRWVRKGGSLLLVADHMPAAGAAAALARSFGIHFTNGYTYQRRPPGLRGDLFTLSDGLLRRHAVQRGRTTDEVIDTIMTFTGQAFQASRAVDTVMVFDRSAVTYLPSDAEADFDSTTATVYSGSWLHAVCFEEGAGRVAVFGEAGLFSAQLAGPQKHPMGMNHPSARQNRQLALNVMHWLSRKL